MCYIRFIYDLEAEGGGPASARCVALQYDTENLDGREQPRAGKVLAQWIEGKQRSYQRWVRDTVDEQRQRLLTAGTITETYKERFRRIGRADK